MPTQKIRKFRKNSKCLNNDCTKRAYQIVKYAHESCHSLLDAFRKLKGSRAGAATDEEQDVLRSILVSSGSGLDSSLKQLFRDSLQTLILQDEGVRIAFEKFIDKELRRGSGEHDIDTKLIAKALSSPLPILPLIDRYIYDLTGSSLQSSEQLFAAASALGLEPVKDLALDKTVLAPAFEARNKIVHELDIDFEGKRRNRVQRKVEDMVEMSNNLLVVSQHFVEVTRDKIKN